MPRLSARERIGLRLAGRSSADPRDIGRRLRKALKRSNERAQEAGDQAETVQLFGEALAAWQYAEWSAARRRKGGGTPDLTSPEHYALVLHAIPPAHVDRFVRRGTYSELFGPPQVGMFEASVEYQDALAGTVAAWIEGQPNSLALAPPLLRSYGPMAELADGPKGAREQRARSRRHLRALEFGLPWMVPAARPPS